MMLDPGMIGTGIIWRNAEARTALELERSGAQPKRSRNRTVGLTRSLARSLRSVADKLEPTATGKVA